MVTHADRARPRRPTPARAHTAKGAPRGGCRNLVRCCMQLGVLWHGRANSTACDASPRGVRRMHVRGGCANAQLHTIACGHYSPTTPAENSLQRLRCRLLPCPRGICGGSELKDKAEPHSCAAATQKRDAAVALCSAVVVSVRVGGVEKETASRARARRPAAFFRYQPAKKRSEDLYHTPLSTERECFGDLVPEL